jgi:hypothetical protein
MRKRNARAAFAARGPLLALALLSCGGPSANAPVGGIGHWAPLSAWSGASLPSAVWTGAEMIVWGGMNSTQGAGYDPVRDAWTPIADPSVALPYFSSVYLGAVVWTGEEMLVWGGRDVNGQTPIQGAAYDPATDAWRTMATDGAPSGRTWDVAVWTGTAMVVWGGSSYTPTNPPSYTSDDDGASYDPVRDRWRPISSAGAPPGRSGATAVWTGSVMVVWGGGDAHGLFGDGGVYDPSADRWSPVASEGAPAARENHTAVWTGSEMIVWGGSDGTRALVDGAAYSPSTNHWRALSTRGAPGASGGAVWTGKQMLVWGGSDPTQIQGGAYDPSADAWTAMSAARQPAPRAQNLTFWTGTEMLVWGGSLPDVEPWYDDGGRFTP